MSGLEGIRVLDLSRLIPGPYATQLLADEGAQVIKVEAPPEGDYLRRIGPSLGMEEAGRTWSIGAIFARLNRGKLSVSLNFQDPRGRDALLRIARTADVWVESFRPGMLDRRGLGFADLTAVNPRIVYCSLSGYGQEGPYVQRAGHDLNYIGLAGILGLNANEGGAPIPPPVQIADLVGGMNAAIKITAALLDRDRIGREKRIDVPLFDGAVEWMEIVLGSTYRAEGENPRRGGSILTGRYPCYHVYETSDGTFMSLGALEPRFWQGFCRAIGREDLLESQFAETAIEAVAAIFRSKTRLEWTTFAQSVDVCLEPVLAIDEIAMHPQVQARRLLQDDTRHVPALGEHTTAILSEVGYGEAEIMEMQEDGVFGIAGS